MAPNSSCCATPATPPTRASKPSSTRRSVTPPPTIRARDRPGKGHNSEGHGRSAVAQTDWHQQDEDRFAVHTADLLDRLATDGWAEHIVVIAAPKTLGEMRKHYSKAIETRLLGELHKELTGETVVQIAQQLAAA